MHWAQRICHPKLREFLARTSESDRRIRFSMVQIRLATASTAIIIRIKKNDTIGFDGPYERGQKRCCYLNSIARIVAVNGMAQPMQFGLQYHDSRSAECANRLASVSERRCGTIPAEALEMQAWVHIRRNAHENPTVFSLHLAFPGRRTRRTYDGADRWPQ